MMRLNSIQLRAVNDVILSLYEDLAGPEPLEPIIDLLETVLPVSYISVDEAFVATKRVVHRAGRRLEQIPQLEEKLALFAHQNPVIAYAQNGGFRPALRISDFISFRAFRRTAFYQELARFLPGWRDQAAVPVRLPESSLGFAFNRDRIFSDEERLMLQLIQPHVERVLRRALLYLNLASQSPLTPREREVLHWVAEGKRDSEIAVILKLSARTVEQHVRVCLRKLGAETRGAAAATIWRARCSSGGTIQ